MMRLTFRFTRFTAGSSMNSSASAREQIQQPPARVLDLRVAAGRDAARGGVEERLGVPR